MKMQPLIVCATIDKACQAYFDALRRTYYPKHRNHQRAHWTLFHRLPVAAAKLLAELTKDTMPLTAAILPPQHTGFGVSYPLHAPELLDLRQQLIARLPHALLIPQDRLRSELHVTVQHGATAFASRQLANRLYGEFSPMECTVLGLSLYYYQRSAWVWVENLVFGQG